MSKEYRFTAKVRVSNKALARRLMKKFRHWVEDQMLAVTSKKDVPCGATFEEESIKAIRRKQGKS